MLLSPSFAFLPHGGARSVAPRRGENGMRAPGRLPHREIDPSLLQALFNELPDVVFFAKDAAGRYLCVNHTLMMRCGFKRRDRILGLTAEQVYPMPLGAAYLAQDRLVLQKGIEIRNKLELHLYPGGGQGWCLT